MRGLDCDGRLLKSEPKSCVRLIHTSKDSLAQLPTSFTFNQYSFSVNWSYELTHHNWCIYISLALALSFSLALLQSLFFSCSLSLDHTIPQPSNSQYAWPWFALKNKKGQGSIDRLPFILWLKSCPACLIKLARPNKLQSLAHSLFSFRSNSLDHTIPQPSNSQYAWPWFHSYSIFKQSQNSFNVIMSPFVSVWSLACTN